MHIEHSIEPVRIQLLGQQVPNLVEGEVSNPAIEEHENPQVEKSDYRYALEGFSGLPTHILTQENVDNFENLFMRSHTYRQLRQQINAEFPEVSNERLPRRLNNYYNNFENRLGRDEESLVIQIRTMQADVFEQEVDEEDDYI